MSGNISSDAKFQAEMNEKIKNAHSAVKALRMTGNLSGIGSKAKRLLGATPKNNSYKAQQLLGHGGKHRRTRRRRVRTKKCKSNRRK